MILGKKKYFPPASINLAEKQAMLLKNGLNDGARTHDNRNHNSRCFLKNQYIKVNLSHQNQF
jgi:hypothetical protein